MSVGFEFFTNFDVHTKYSAKLIFPMSKTKISILNIFLILKSKIKNIPNSTIKIANIVLILGIL